MAYYLRSVGYQFTPYSTSSSTGSNAAMGEWNQYAGYWTETSVAAGATSTLYAFNTGGTKDVSIEATIQILAGTEIETVKVLERKLSHIKTPITLSIIGCVVNGPGEAAMTDVGITGGNKGSNMLYLSGIQSEKVLTNDMIEKVVSAVEKKVLDLKKNLNDTTKNN